MSAYPKPGRANKLIIAMPNERAHTRDGASPCSRVHSMLLS